MSKNNKIGQIKPNSANQVTRSSGRTLLVLQPTIKPKPVPEDDFNQTIRHIKTLARTLLVEIESLTLAACREFERDLDFYDMVKKFEVNLIERALLKTGGHQRHAARLLGLRAGTLSSKMKLYNIKLKPELETQVEKPSDNHTECHDMIG